MIEQIEGKSGGQIGHVMPDTTRAAIARAWIGHHHSLEARAKMSAAQKGIPKSPEHCAKLSQANMGKPGKKGSTSPTWKGGITPENELARASTQYDTWRTSVYARDDYTCSVCGKRGVVLEAHHINGFSEHKDVRLDVENGVTMCRPCHKQFHLIFGQLHNTLEELQEFVMIQEA